MTFTDLSDGVVLVEGTLDIATAPEFVARFTGADLPSSLEIDLSGVDFCDSTGLSAIIEVWRHTDATGCSLVLSNPARPVQRLFEIAGVMDVLPVRAATPASDDQA